MSATRLGDARSNRVDPLMLNAVHEDHVARYQLARRYAAGAAVLDVGCATGYGSALLAEVAASVVGIDPFEAAVEYASEHYAGQNRSFRVGLLGEVALDEASFDLAVAFEVIEHVEDPVAFADHVRRLLRPGGRAIFSTPHGPVSAPDGGVSDPTHLREFDSEELTDVLTRAGFSEIQLLGQHIGAGMWRRHSTRALLGRLDVLGLRRLLPARAKARVIVAASGIGASEADRTSTQSTITDELEGAFVQIAICRP